MYRFFALIPIVLVLFIGTTTTNNDTFGAISEPENCAKDTDKRPTSLEYVAHFNCGNTEKEEGVRHFTLIAEENQTVPISNMGHQFQGWTFNDTIPGPTMRM